MHTVTHTQPSVNHITAEANAPRIHFCTCGKATVNACQPDTSKPAPVITIIAKRSATLLRTVYTAVVFDRDDNAIVNDLQSQYRAYTPCDAVAAASRAAYATQLTFRPDLIVDDSRIDWADLVATVGAQLYQRGVDAYIESGGNPDAYVSATQRITVAGKASTQQIKRRAQDILDNAASIAGWQQMEDARENLADEIDDLLSSGYGLEWDEDEVMVNCETIDGCTITLLQVTGGYIIETRFITTHRSELYAEFDAAFADYEQKVKEERAIVNGMDAEHDTRIGYSDYAVALPF